MSKTRNASVACLVAFLAAPAFADDVPDTQDRGRTLYMVLCSGCHGTDASGGNAPDIQGTSAKHLGEALDGIEEMPAFELPQAEINALVLFLAAPNG